MLASRCPNLIEQSIDNFQDREIYVSKRSSKTSEVGKCACVINSNNTFVLHSSRRDGVAEAYNTIPIFEEPFDILRAL